MRERQTFVAREIPGRHDKAVRAQTIRGRMAMERLYVPEHAPWLEPLRSELLMFPAGATDDQVDALSLVGQLLDQARLRSEAEADGAGSEAEVHRSRSQRLQLEDAVTTPTEELVLLGIVKNCDYLAASARS